MLNFNIWTHAEHKPFDDWLRKSDMKKMQKWEVEFWEKLKNPNYLEESESAQVSQPRMLNDLSVEFLRQKCPSLDNTEKRTN